MQSTPAHESFDPIPKKVKTSGLGAAAEMAIADEAMTTTNTMSFSISPCPQ
jgi:hypothetical protein